MAIKTEIAFQGEYGAYSHQAVRHLFGARARSMPCRSFEEVFRAVRSGATRYGVIPIENSLEGSIHQNYDLLEASGLFITGEITLRIVHALVARPGARLSAIRFITSHPQALGQCRRFLSTRPGVEIIPAYDTAGAAREISESRRKDIAAIASLEAARMYRLAVLRRGIEDNPRNFTRFLVLCRTGKIARKHARTSLVVTLPDAPGALFRALSAFALRDIDLARIESRPRRDTPWEYVFTIDFRGSMHDARCRHAVDQLREMAKRVTVLGSYPIGPTVHPGRS